MVAARPEVAARQPARPLARSLDTGRLAGTGGGRFVARQWLGWRRGMPLSDRANYGCCLLRARALPKAIGPIRAIGGRDRSQNWIERGVGQLRADMERSRAR